MSGCVAKSRLDKPDEHESVQRGQDGWTSCPMMRDTSGGPCLAGMATPHWNLLHILSTLLIGGGFVLLKASGRVLYEAQRQHTLAVTGPYAHLRHPQYAAFVVLMLGFLFQWPTLLTYSCSRCW